MWEYGIATKLMDAEQLLMPLVSGQRNVLIGQLCGIVLCSHHFQANSTWQREPWF